MKYAQALEEQYRMLRMLEGKSLTTKGGLQLDRGCIRILERAESFFVEDHICDLVAHSRDSLPEVELSPSTLPCDAGFIWLEKPVSVPTEFDSQSPALGAILWSAARTDSGYYEACTLGDAQSVIVAMCTMYLGRAIPFTLFEWRFGASVDAAIDELASADMDGMGATARLKSFVRTFITLLLFMQQRIASKHRHDVARATRRRVSDWAHDPVVQVITLRRRLLDPASSHHQPDDIEWRCRWIVSGHWRQQWYPSMGRHIPKWILPYVKGPDDKPLKVEKAHVFAVVR